MTRETARGAETRDDDVVSPGDSFMIVDRGWRIIHANDRAIELARRPREQVLGGDFQEVYPNGALARYRHVMETGQVAEFERLAVSGHWWSLRAWPCEDGIAIRAREITLEKERDLSTAMVEASRAAVTLDLPEVIAKIGERFRKHFRWDITGLLLHDPAENALRVHFLSFPPMEHRPALPEGTLSPLDGTVSGLAFTSGAPAVCNTLAEFARFGSDAAQKIRDAGYRSVAAVPIVCRGKKLGTLVANGLNEHAFDPEAVELMTRIADVIAPAVDNALAYRELNELKEKLAKEKQYLDREADAGFVEIVGESPALASVLERAKVVAPTDATVLVSGETGTGKELIARAIHRLSDRHERTFVKLNCAAIPTGLLESELFGHERGAFTGAVAQKVGRFELADGGTLFLDELAELPLELQPKLLRVLQDHELERLGGTKTIRVDVRFIAATNRDLPTMVVDGTFREDLFYRLNVFPIALPPLRERLADLPLLVRHLVERCARRHHKRIETIPQPVLDAFARYDWPGNVRELENVIERSVILSRGPSLEVGLAELFSARREKRAGHAVGIGTLFEVERDCILRALAETGWVVGGRKGAAARLGLNRTTLQARMRKHGIKRPG
jgi:formate hydrogenlyase transcriptional activator